MSNKTKRILKEAAFRAVKLHEARKIIKKTVLETVLQERANLKQINRILSEGPFSNVWQGVKSAGSTIGQGLKSAFGAASKASNQQSVAQNQQTDQLQSLLKQMTTLAANVEKARQKFQAELLKDTQVITSYADSLVNLVRANNMLQGLVKDGAPLHLGQTIEKITQDASEKEKTFRSDLQSEKSAIDTFLSSFDKSSKMTADDDQKEQESEIGRSSMGRAAAAGRTGKSQQYNTVQNKSAKDEDERTGADQFRAGLNDQPRNKTGKPTGKATPISSWSKRSAEAEDVEDEIGDIYKPSKKSSSSKKSSKKK